MNTGCSDVCEVVHYKLRSLGFDIDPEAEEHDDMLAALEHVDFYRQHIPAKGPLGHMALSSVLSPLFCLASGEDLTRSLLDALVLAYGPSQALVVSTTINEVLKERQHPS
jgi:hypothetical protein